MQENTFDVSTKIDTFFWCPEKVMEFQSLEIAEVSACSDFDHGSFQIQEKFDLDQDEEELDQSQKNTVKQKKRRSKFKSKADNLDTKDDRDIKKYAKLDISNLIFEQFTNKQGDQWEEVQNLLTRHNVSKRSLRCFFLTIGLLKKLGKLKQYYKFYRLKVKQVIHMKYHHRSQYFKRHLQKALRCNQNAIELFQVNNYEKAFEVSYGENLRGQKGKTKNPKQMEKCKQLYFNIFPSELGSNSVDLDIFFNSILEVTFQ